MKLLKEWALIASFALLGFASNAQIFFTENFEGTPGTNGLPASWTETGLSTDGIWVMGNDVAASSVYLTFPPTTQGTNFAYTSDDACNCDKSADRMILPAQDFSSLVGVELIYDVFLPGTYGGIGTVEVSTDNGVTWTVVSTIATNAAWQDDVLLNLSAYAGAGFTNVLVSFLYNDGAAWADGMGVDEVRLNQLATLAPDMEMTSIDLYEYTIVPLSQSTSIALTGDVTNVGSADATDATLTVNVYDATNLVTPIQTTASPSTAVIIGASANLNAGSFVPTVEATYLFEYISTATGDVNSVNDTLVDVVVVSNDLYARDDSNITFNAGIGAGPTGYLGTMYTITTTTRVDSVLAAFTKPGTSTVSGDGVGDSTRFVVYDVVGGLPGTILGQSPAYQFAVADTGVLIVRTLAIEANGGGALVLTPGDYFVAVEENNTNVGLSFTDDKFQNSTFYFSWTGQPWTPAENFPVQFQRAPVIRPILDCSSTGTDVLSACDSLTWIDGITYTASNNTATWTLQNVSGCDSVVTLDLTINTSNSGVDVLQACDSLVWIDGVTYTASNNSAVWTVQNVAGCDSIVTLDLTITTTITTNDVVSECESYTWIDGNTYTASNNTATWTVTGTGCDSLFTLDLTITGYPSNTVTQTGTTLSSDESGATYQWLDCDNGNSPITGETGQDYTPTVTGNYAVVVTLNGCSDTSACTLVDFTGLSTLYAENLTLFPNPSENELNVNGLESIPNLVSVSVTSLDGKELLDLAAGNESFDVSKLTSGMYFFVIEYGDSQKEAIKFVKK